MIMKIVERYRFMVVSMTIFTCFSSTSAQQLLDYTEERPLTIVCDWEFPPYEYLNNEGKPDGFNVEILSIIFNKFKIPHRFVMMEWSQGAKLFEQREGDLIHSLSSHYRERPYVMTRNLITDYPVKVVRLKNTPPLLRLDSLQAGDTLICKRNDYASLRIEGERTPVFTMEYRTPQEALSGIINGRYKYFIWGEAPLNWKIKELALNSVVTDDIDIPTGELRFIGYDIDLINLIDDEYARMVQSGEMENILDKWFHPERVHNDASPVALLILAGIFLVGLVALLLSRLIRLRVKAAVHKSVDLNNMMEQAVQMGDYYVVECDLKTNMIKNQYGHLIPDEGMSISEFNSRILPEKQDAFKKNLEQMRSGDTEHWTFRSPWNAGTPDSPQWKLLDGDSIIELENGKPRFIVNTVKDITKDVEEERLNNEMASKYMKMFDNSVVAMSFYDKDGMLLDLNENMRILCEFDEQGEQYFRSTCMFDIPLFRDDFERYSHDDFHVCQTMHYPDLGIKKYIEFRIHPTFDDNDEVVYYVFTARDITEERKMYLEQKKHDEEIQATNDTINQYERQLNYLLAKSDMFVWQFDFAKKVIYFSRSLHATEYSETLEEFLEGMTEESRQQASENIKSTVAVGKPLNTIHHFKHTPNNPNPIWYAISGIPNKDKEGNITSYYGVVRNITSLMNAQEKLRQETARAEDSGRMKSAFLANMTHEIRTPLNAIVGFSDILQMVDTQEERMEFIRIIRNNCDMLLRLINDILEASSMGQALAIEPTACDFSQVFDDICQTLAQRVQEPGVEFIKDNPYKTFPATLDKGRVQQVLTNFTTNAVKYTHEGHIKVGYREEGEGIYFYCEDTGAGIPKDKQTAVFDRFVKLNDFVQGTGLGLSICKSICERCGGKIGVTSEGEGHGSTFWMWIPRIVKIKTE